MSSRQGRTRWGIPAHRTGADLHNTSYAVVPYSCSIAFCCCVGLAAWRGDNLQLSDATGYYWLGEARMERRSSISRKVSGTLSSNTPQSELVIAS